MYSNRMRFCSSFQYRRIHRAFLRFESDNSTSVCGSAGLTRRGNNTCGPLNCVLTPTLFADCSLCSRDGRLAESSRDLLMPTSKARRRSLPVRTMNAAVECHRVRYWSAGNSVAGLATTLDDAITADLPLYGSHTSGTSLQSCGEPIVHRWVMIGGCAPIPCTISPASTARPALHVYLIRCRPRAL